MKDLIAAVAIAASASGCYYYYPKSVPKLNGALVVEGQRIELTGSHEQRWEECSDYQYKHDQCEVRHAKLKHPYTVYHATATYGGRELTRAEFFELAMADYPDRIKGIEDRRGTCRISLVPSAIAVAAAIAAIGVPLLFSTHFTDDEQKTIYYTGGAVAVGSALLSYPLGGFACVKANSLASDLLDGAKSTEWTAFHEEDFAPLEKMANDFNAKHGGAAPPPAPDSSPEVSERDASP